MLKMAKFPSAPALEALSLFSRREAARTREFHQTLPGYRETPLWELSALSHALGIESIHVKDESFRFGLNAFKALGASWAVHCLPEAPQGLATATDGNHGRGVAWTARLRGLPCRVYLPRKTARERVENIRREGAEAIVTDLEYDDAVRLARKAAGELGWTLVQDTVVDDNREIPLRIMQGYMTMALEAVERLRKPPTHVFLQAGVGSMAGAVAAFLGAYYGEARPRVIVVEPRAYDCHYLSALAGEIRFAEGGETIMAGLACAEPNPLSWSILTQTADEALSIPEYWAADGMRVLANPLAGDPRIVSGESGASGFGALFAILHDPELNWAKEGLCLDENSRALIFSTEGATDRENYYEIVWKGKFRKGD